MSSKYQINRTNRFLFLGIFLLAVFVLAAAVWYAPILFKGYNPYGPSDGSLLARNLYESDFYSTNDNLDITLSSNLVKDYGVLSAKGNRLTPLLYSKIFNLIGLPGTGGLFFLSILLRALTLLIFTGLVLYLFNLRTAGIFSLIYIFLPFNWQGNASGYEFALLFLSLFFLSYLYGIKGKYGYIYLPFSGIFLVLACLSKEALFLIAPFLLLFLWFKKQKQQLLYIFVPFLIILAIFWLPDIVHNSHIKLLDGDISKGAESSDLHLYPDPYTYYFEQEEFLTDLKNKINDNELVLIKELDRIKELRNVGAGGISLFDRMRVSLVIGSRHIFRFMSLEDIGGPFILLLIILGLYNLRQKNRYLYQFFIYWIFSALFLMSFVVLVARNHLMDFNWAIALLISLGLLKLAEIIIDYFQFQMKKATAIYLAIFLTVLYQLVLVNHIGWSKIYDKSSNLMIQAYSQEIKKLNIIDKDVIAVGLDPGAMYGLNYLTNKSVVIFRPETIKNLMTKNKLDFAFNEFSVKYILGYSDQLSEEIIHQTDVVNIASDSIKPIIPEISRNKGWLMNLIK